MLSICQLHLQLPFDDRPTVAAACSRRRHSTVCDTPLTSAAATVGQSSSCVCLCNYWPLW